MLWKFHVILQFYSVFLIFYTAHFPPMEKESHPLLFCTWFQTPSLFSTSGLGTREAPSFPSFFTLQLHASTWEYIRKVTTHCSLVCWWQNWLTTQERFRLCSMSTFLTWLWKFEHAISDVYLIISLPQFPVEILVHKMSKTPGLLRCILKLIYNSKLMDQFCKV